MADTNPSTPRGQRAPSHDGNISASIFAPELLEQTRTELLLTHQGDRLQLRGRGHVDAFFDRDQDHHHFRVRRGESPRDLDAVDAGHAHVEQDEVRREALHRRETLVAGRRLAGHLEAGRRVDHVARHVPEQHLVVDGQDTNAARRGGVRAERHVKGHRLKRMYARPSTPGNGACPPMARVHAPPMGMERAGWCAPPGSEAGARPSPRAGGVRPSGVQPTHGEERMATRPSTPPSEEARIHHMSQPEGGSGSTGAWAGWVTFASTVMVLLGCLNGFQGFLALFDEGYFAVRGEQLVLVSYEAWGAILIAWGVVLLVVGAALNARRGWARWLAALIVMVDVILQVGF